MHQSTNSVVPLPTTPVLRRQTTPSSKYPKLREQTPIRNGSPQKMKNSVCSSGPGNRPKLRKAWLGRLWRGKRRRYLELVPRALLQCDQRLHHPTTTRRTPQQQRPPETPRLMDRNGQPLNKKSSSCTARLRLLLDELRGRRFIHWLHHPVPIRHLRQRHPSRREEVRPLQLLPAHPRLLR